MKILLTIIIVFLNVQAIFSQQIDYKCFNESLITLNDSILIKKEFNNSDFEQLKKLLGSKKIILLGEQSHGDGSTFEMKVLLIKYLHEKLGFNVLAFENSLFDLDFEAKQITNNGKDPICALHDGLFPIWAYSNETQSLFSYIKLSNESSSPINFSGFDFQFSSKKSADNLISEIKNQISASDSVIIFKKCNWRQFTSIIKQSINSPNHYKPTKIEDTIFNDGIMILKQYINQKTTITSIEKGMWNLYFENLQLNLEFNKNWSLAKFIFNKNYKSTRDIQMAKNLIALIKLKFSNQKVIIWAANIHIEKKISKINSKALLGYKGLISMGDILEKEFKDSLYSLIFTSSTGEVATCLDKKSWKIPPPPRKSLEKYFEMQNRQNLILNFNLNRTKNCTQLKRKMLLSVNGYRFESAVWLDIADGIFYIKTMKRSTLISKDYYNTIHEKR